MRMLLMLCTCSPPECSGTMEAGQLKPVARAIDAELQFTGWESDNGCCYLLQPWELPGSGRPNGGGGSKKRLREAALAV